MTLYEKILLIYPELKSDRSRAFWDGTIQLRQDDEEIGPYIEVWNYEKPQPTEEELAAMT